MKISVIMPVYNAETYLRFSVGSVVEAAKRFDGETELICVDDGSTDGTGALLDAFAGKFKTGVAKPVDAIVPIASDRRDPFWSDAFETNASTGNGRPTVTSSTLPSDFNFRVIHQANAGVSAARNAGMALASGELVAFLDSDDTYDPLALAGLAEIWTKTGAEVIRFGCKGVTDHVQDARLEAIPPYAEINVDLEATTPLKRCALGAATAVSSAIAKQIPWPLLTQCEDPLFVLRCLRRSRKSVFVDGPLVNYLIRPNSASHAVSLDIVTATCRYLPLAYDECARFPGFERSRQDTCAFLAGFLDGPLAKCGRDVARGDRRAAEAAVRTTRNLLAVRDPAFAKYACRESHDFAFALGSSCTATDVLRQADLQFATFPLDWIGRLDVGVRAEFIVSGFSGFLSEDRLHLETGAGDGRHAHCVDGKFGTAFFHDFTAGVPLAESFPAVREKYDRRIARFVRQLSEAKSVLVVWIADFRDERDGINASDAALSRCLDRLARRFPGTHFSMLVFDQAVAGDPAREIRVTDGRIRRIALDYRDWSQGPDSWSLQTEKLLPYLLRHGVRDYRSAAEKREYRRREFAEKRERLHATSWLDTLMVDLQYRLFRHLQKRLTRRGVKLGEEGGTRE